ncbi:glycosyltransferase family 2 protein [candidate division FCPU426 bacterium]|nr:glycosyltransferase family 2 protein [candidate division FCPU426 bacterium]
MDISVVVSNFNGAAYLEKLLSSLRRQKGVDLEIIVVDRNSTDGSLDMLARTAGVRIISEPPQTGLAAGYARGLAAARAELVFFCNEDLYLEENCLQYLRAAIALEKRICAADPWQWDYAGVKRIHGGTRFRKVRWALHSSHAFREYSFQEELPAGGLIPFACAGAFMIHRRAMEEAGGWDTTFFIDNEDVDLFLRLWQKDWYAVNVPQARVFHDVGGSLKQRLPGTKTTVSRRRYLSDWSSKVILACKYFSWPQIMISLANGIVRQLNNLRHLRLKLFFWDWEAGWEVLRRLPGALAFRRSHCRENRARPGQDFFTWEAYQTKRLSH